MQQAQAIRDAARIQDPRSVKLFGSICKMGKPASGSSASKKAVKQGNWSIHGSGRSMTKKQIGLVQKAADASSDDPKKFFQLLGRLPKSSWKGMRCRIEKGDKGESETILFS